MWCKLYGLNLNWFGKIEINVPSNIVIIIITINGIIIIIIIIII